MYSGADLVMEAQNDLTIKLAYDDQRHRLGLLRRLPIHDEERRPGQYLTIGLCPLPMSYKFNDINDQNNDIRQGCNECCHTRDDKTDSQSCTYSQCYTD